MGILFLSIAVNALLIGVLYLIARRRIHRLLGGEEAMDGIRDEVNHLVVELNQTADRNIGIIEERIDRLKKLVDDADRKITLLGKESEKVRIGADVYERLKRSKSLLSEAHPNDHGEVDPDAKPKAKSDVESKAPVTQQKSGRKTGSETGGGAAEVLELYRQGFEPKIIAAKTGSSLGEIELIISLAGGR